MEYIQVSLILYLLYSPKITSEIKTGIVEIRNSLRVIALYVGAVFIHVLI